jgi:hypothetical protein
MIKQRIIAIQFQGKSGEKINEGLAGAAGYLTSGLATSAKTQQAAWFSGMVGELDQASLVAMKDKEPISFPGWVQGWKSADDASGYLKALASKDEVKDVKQVIFEVTDAPCVEVLGNRVVSHRLAGTLAGDAVLDTTTNIVTIKVTGKAWDERTLADSVLAANKVADPPAATPPPATDPPATDPPATEPPAAAE